MRRLPINIASVSTADNIVKAGVRMLQNIEDQYVDDPAIDPVDKTLMVFASYNAGPNLSFAKILAVHRMRNLWRSRTLAVS